MHAQLFCCNVTLHGREGYNNSAIILKGLSRMGNRCHWEVEGNIIRHYLFQVHEKVVVECMVSKA